LAESGRLILPQQDVCVKIDSKGFFKEEIVSMSATGLVCQLMYEILILLSWFAKRLDNLN
jgi:hypothetical protein